MLPGLERLQADQGERHDFERGEAGAECDHGRGRAGEVQVVEHAQHAARHVDDGREQHVDGRGRARTHEAELDEQEADDGGGEDLEEAFDPQVNDPPAPVFDHRDVGVLAPHEAGAVQESDRDG